MKMKTAISQTIKYSLFSPTIKESLSFPPAGGNVSVRLVRGRQRGFPGGDACVRPTGGRQRGYKIKKILILSPCRGKGQRKACREADKGGLREMPALPTSFKIMNLQLLAHKNFNT
jgi:hypothetical protein